MMRRGCISLGEIKCDLCQRLIPQAERYLATEEELADGEKSKIKRYCLDCCLKQGYAEYRNEKTETILTFFPEKEAGKP
ncbi:MAG: hypothetical protein ABIB93_06800 [Chloroflexota bacterium]